MPGRKVIVKKTRNPAMNQFAKRLKKQNRELFDMITRGDTLLESARKIASVVNFPRAISSDEVIADVLNELWPYIVRYKSEERTGS